MLRISLLTLYFICISSNFLGCFADKFKSSISMCDLIKRTKPLPYPTLAPTDVKTDEAVQVNTSSPLVIRASLFTPVIVENTGYSFVIRANPPPTSFSTFGGILCGEHYAFHQFQFFVSKDLNSRSLYTLDGKGAPLSVSIEYYNTKYETFEKALNYRNGIVIEYNSISFLPFDNPLFYPLEFLRKFLREPGSKLILPGFLAYGWFDAAPFIETYYAFFSAYVDLKTRHQYESVIAGTPKIFYSFISKRQFEAFFLYLRNKDGEVLENVLPLQPFGERDLIKANRLTQQLALF